MPVDYSIEEIELDLFQLETPADIRHQINLERIGAACKEHGITFTEGWATPTGRIGLAQVILAKVSKRDDEARRLEAEWLSSLEGENG